MDEAQILKWIDELQGQIDGLKRQVSGGGSTFSLTPTLLAGVKIADYISNGVRGEVFAPSIGTTPSVIGYDGNTPIYAVIKEYENVPMSVRDDVKIGGVFQGMDVIAFQAYTTIGSYTLPNGAYSQNTTNAYNIALYKDGDNIRGINTYGGSATGSVKILIIYKSTQTIKKARTRK